MGTSPSEERDDEVAALRREVEELRARERVPARPEPRPGRRRRTAVVLLLVLGCVLAPLAAGSAWLRNQVTDTDRYVRTVTPLASDHAIQVAVADEVTRELFARVDIDREVQEALPRDAPFVAAAITAGIVRVTEDATLRLLQSDRFETLWIEVNRIAHAQLVKVLTGGGEALQTEGGRVVLDLGPVLEAVKAELAERGITIFEQVPAEAVSTSFVLAESAELEQAQRGVRLLETVAFVLPLAVLACLGGAIALSDRRRRTLLQASLGIAVSMVVLGLALTLARSAYVSQVAGTGLPDDAARAFFDILVHWLRIGIRALFAIALLVAAGAFLTGPSCAAEATRRRFGALVDRSADTTGVRSSSAGVWVGANRRALRLAAILVPVAVFLFWDTPTPSVLVVLVALSLGSLLAIELVGARPAAGDTPAEGGPPPESGGAPEPGG